MIMLVCEEILISDGEHLHGKNALVIICAQWHYHTELYRRIRFRQHLGGEAEWDLACAW